jgi:ribulose-phosphate 3-epimerase
MSSQICPTIDAEDAQTYQAQIERVAPFVTRLHIDVADGSMTPNVLVAPADVWWPGGVRADIHVMYRQPMEHLPALMALGPQLIILHAEAEGDFIRFAEELHRHGIETGIALLPETPVEAILPGLSVIDHVLVFSGNLGNFGGVADFALLEKVQQLKALKPQLEIGWDGGVTDQTAAKLAQGGVEVLNVGGFIQNASDPQVAYATLEVALGNHGHIKSAPPASPQRSSLQQNSSPAQAGSHSSHNIPVRTQRHHAPAAQPHHRRTRA